MIKLANYKIKRKIASGGMGDVYLAEHTVLETVVAIKSLHSNLVNDESFRKRFRTSREPDESSMSARQTEFWPSQDVL